MTQRGFDLTFGLIIEGLALGIRAFAGVGRGLQKVPGCRHLGGIALDTVLGPAEDFEYESHTLSPAPPPA